MSEATHRLKALRRPVVSARLMVDFAQERGLDSDQCLAETGITQAALSDTDATITADQELRLIGNLVQALGKNSDGAGLDLGNRYHLSTYGIWGFAMLSSPTFRSAAEIAVRYLGLSYAVANYALFGEGQDLVWVLDVENLDPSVRQFVVERDVACWDNACREVRPGGFRARRAEFTFPRPTCHDRLEAICGVSPIYNAPRNTLCMQAADLDAALPLADPVLRRMCEEQCRQLLEKRRVRAGFAGQVRDRLMVSPASMPALDDVAKALHLSPRSLRRKLSEEDTSFRALVDEVREALAIEMLITANMKIAEIAERLDYAEPAAFINAFKRWTGMSPAAYRESQRAG